MTKIIVGRILGRPPYPDHDKIVVEDVDTEGVYTLDRMSNKRLVEPREDWRSGYGGLLYEFEVGVDE